MCISHCVGPGWWSNGWLCVVVRVGVGVVDGFMMISFGMYLVVQLVCCAMRQPVGGTPSGNSLGLGWLILL